MTAKLNEYQLKNGTVIDPSKIIAYFDFDGTLTRHDTLIHFVIYVSGILKFLVNSPILLIIAILYFIRLISNEKAKELFLTIMIRGVKKQKIDILAKRFALSKLDKYIKPEIYTRLEYHLEHGHNVILVSANLAIYLHYWALKHHINGVIATEIEFDQHDIATGKLLTRNCYGEEKLKRIYDYLLSHKAEYIYSYGYGNSAGDYSLLKYVDEGYWIKGTDIISWEEYSG
ncbi:MAG: HAD-IB family hydrolase [Neisseriaceae bacterium]